MKDKKEKIRQVSVRLADSDKMKLEKLAKEKGCDGLTGLLRLMAKAKGVDINI